MTATTALLVQTDKPAINAMADALHQDAFALASEWSRGDVLSMISDKRVAEENTARMLLMAAASALTDAGDGSMADLIRFYLTGRTAEMQFAFRDRHTASDLEDGAEGIERMADEIVTRFRAGAEELAA